MERLYIAAQAIEPGDIVLSNSVHEPSYIYADRAHGSYLSDCELYVYVPTSDDRFRFAYDQQVTVLRGI